MSLVRIPLTLAAAVAFHVSMSPPTRVSDTPDDKRAIFTTAHFITTMLTKGLFWASALTDTLVMLTPHLPTSLPTLPSISIPPTGALLSWIRHLAQRRLDLALSLNLPTSLFFSLPLLPPLPLVTIMGATLALAGARLRYAAYDALGQFYACPNRGTGPCVPHGDVRGHAHALITTGPYAFVRHPGYAGLVLCTTGAVVLHLDALRMGGVGPGVSAGMRTVALACTFLATVGALRRIRDEERALRARFKGEWEAWAGRVRYRLVPGMY